MMMIISSPLFFSWQIWLHLNTFACICIRLHSRACAMAADNTQTSDIIWPNYQARTRSICIPSNTPPQRYDETSHFVVGLLFTQGFANLTLT